MIVVVLAVLGVPLWLVAGALGGALWSRRRFLAQPGVFRVKLLDDGSWPKRPSFGQLVHDVLVVNSGVALVRTSVIGLAEISTPDQATPPPPDAFDAVFRIRTDDGTIAVVAVQAAVVARWQDMAERSAGSPEPHP